MNKKPIELQIKSEAVGDTRNKGLVPCKVFEQKVADTALGMAAASESNKVVDLAHEAENFLNSIAFTYDGYGVESPNNLMKSHNGQARTVRAFIDSRRANKQTPAVVRLADELYLRGAGRKSRKIATGDNYLKKLIEDCKSDISATETVADLVVDAEGDEAAIEVKVIKPAIDIHPVSTELTDFEPKTLEEPKIDPNKLETRHNISPRELREALAFKQITKEVESSKPEWPEDILQKERDLKGLHSDYKSKFGGSELVGLGQVVNRYEASNAEAIVDTDPNKLAAKLIEAIRSNPGGKIAFDKVFPAVVSTYAKTNVLKAQYRSEGDGVMAARVGLQAETINLATQLGTIGGCELPFDICILEKVVQCVEYEISSQHVLAKQPEYNLYKGELREKSAPGRIVGSIGRMAVGFVCAAVDNGLHSLPYVGSFTTNWWLPGIVSDRNEQKHQKNMDKLEQQAAKSRDLWEEFFKLNHTREREAVEAAIIGSDIKSVTNC